MSLLRICAALLLTCGIVHLAGAADAPRPNILVIVADDMGFGDVGWHGTEIKTPNIDALASSGVKLEQFYVQPLCSPTRASLMTGRYPMRLGLQVGVIRPWAQFGLSLDERMLPQALHDVGYETAISGKWHLGLIQPAYLPTHRGFDHQYGHYNGAVDYFTHERDGGFDWHRDDKVCHDEGYSTSLIAKEAVVRIQDRDKSKPLFLYVPFNAVHAPYEVPPSYMKPYAALKEPRRIYAGMVAAMDEGIGQILAAVDAAGIRDNTLILFTSDNGGPQPGIVTSNGPLRGGKGSLYEGGVRVAACASWAGHIPAGGVVNAPLHIVDFYPTLLKLAGAKLEQPLPIDGLDAWNTIAHGAPSPHKQLLVNATPLSGAIRVGDWKLVIRGSNTSAVGAEGSAIEKGLSPAGNQKQTPQTANAAASNIPSADAPAELFNIAEDPNEKNNLAKQNPDKVKELRAAYDRIAIQAVPPKLKPKSPDFKSPKVWGEVETAKES